jgi:hypothetical protein
LPWKITTRQSARGRSVDEAAGFLAIRGRIPG